MGNVELAQLLSSPEEQAQFRRSFMQSGDKEAVLRELAAQSVVRFPNNKPLKSFDIVGGLLINFAEGGNLDSHRFFELFFYLLKSGVPLSPDFTVRVSNLLYGEDYLKTNHKADITLISFVPLLDDDHSDSSAKIVDVDRPTGWFVRAAHEFQTARHKDSSTAVSLGADANRAISPLNTVAHWIKRLKFSESKLIFSIYEGLEVDLNVVAPDNYVPLGRAVSYDFPHDKAHLPDLITFGRATWQVIGEQDYVQLAIHSIRLLMNPDTGKVQPDYAKRGTELGNGIYRGAMALFEKAMAAIDKAEAEGPVRNDKVRNDGSKPEDKKL